MNKKYMMKLREIFEKRINRDIQGVVKVGQDQNPHIYQELEEYVVTRELTRHFAQFFAAYQRGLHDHTDKMGVWISGFFGSGKSHFLKLISYLLANKDVAGRRAVSYFDTKMKESPILADINQAGAVSTDVILFNIESKSDSDTKDKESIAKVFNKVFNEMQGFCGSLPWLAELERQLSRDGTYDSFKQKFHELSRENWAEVREGFYFHEDHIIQALTETTKMSLDSARNWFEKAERNYSLSVEKFVTQVQNYIESKGANHHVVFLVDEMGQYIADDVGLMLNLQTVVEDLGTYCDGKAWVLVTSQQDIDAITRVKGNDFSKIQGRFNTRISLSSADVGEVIKKRILEKNDVAKETLGLLYQDKEAIIRNLITFSADTAQMKPYQSAQEFVDVYPFVPYYFNLLQSVFTAIRIHGSSGKHISEGERSLLSAFQESVVTLMDHKVGTLIPFYTFYDTIVDFLEHDIKTLIMHAEANQELTKFDVSVLKILFMIKWVKEVPAKVENITCLMIDHIDQEIIDLKHEIEASLKRLIKETLVHKNGEEYIFLTHEEQDVNREIQHMPVDMGEVISKLGEEIFNGIYKDKRFRYSNRYRFDFNKVIDNLFLSGPRYELGMRIITPYYDSRVDLSDNELKMMSGKETDLIVRLPADVTLLQEIEEVEKINAYLIQRGGRASTDVIEEIKVRKSREVSARKERIQSLTQIALRDGELFVNNQKLDVKSKNPVERLNQGLRALVDDNYKKLNYITLFIEKQKDLEEIVANPVVQEHLFDPGQPNALALAEVDQYMERNAQDHRPVTMKKLLDVFANKPWGWLSDDIRGLILRLFQAEEIGLQLGSEYLSIRDKNILRYLTKREYLERVLVKKRIQTPDHHLSNAKNFVRDLFNQSSLPIDEDGLMKRVKELFINEISLIISLLAHYEDGSYPGRPILVTGKELLTKAMDAQDPMSFFAELYQKREQFFDYSDDGFDVKKFF